MGRTLIFLAAVAALAGGCASESAETRHSDPSGANREARARPEATTRLSIRIEYQAVDGKAAPEPRPVEFRLRCDPASGDVPRPDRACRLLATHPDRFFRERAARPSTCLKWVSHAPVMSVTGRRNGEPVNLVFDAHRCVPDQFFAWGRLVGRPYGFLRTA